MMIIIIIKKIVLMIMVIMINFLVINVVKSIKKTLVELKFFPPICSLNTAIIWYMRSEIHFLKNNIIIYSTVKYSSSSGKLLFSQV